VGLCLALLLLRSAWNHGGADHNSWVAHSGSPILITRNDLAFLSVITPFSLALVYRKPWSISGLTGILSIIFSIAAVVIFQSRGATLALLVAVISSVTHARSRLGLATPVAIIVAALIMDGFLGFPLLGRFMDLLSQPSAGRSGHWATAWNMFLDAPLFGHGPQTFALFHPHPWTHNLYLQVLAEQGIIGFAALVSMLFWGLWTAWKTRITICDDIRIFGAAAFGSLLGFCFSSVVELSFLRHWVVVVLFVLLGMITHLAALQVTGNGEGTNDKKNLQKH
jgi:O-antigen ligase